MRKRLGMETMSYQPWGQQLSQLPLLFDFKNMMQSISHLTKKSKALPHKVTVRGDKYSQLSLKVANDATIFVSSAFPISVTDNILPLPPPHDLSIFMTTIKICQNF